MTEPSMPVFASDFQVCMYGGSRPKWTRSAVNLNPSKARIFHATILIRTQHREKPSTPKGKRFGLHQQRHNTHGRREWHSQHVLCNFYKNWKLICHLLHYQIQMQHRPLRRDHLQLSRKKIPPFVPECSGIQTLCVASLSQVPCTLLQKVQEDWHFNNHVIPKASRLLRFKAIHPMGGTGDCFEVVLGLPWGVPDFLNRAIVTGHPVQTIRCLPKDLAEVVNIHNTWDYNEISSRRLAWCKKWLRRATQLDSAEKQDLQRRDDHVQLTTAKTRLLLFEEILFDIGFEDMEV